MKKIFGRSCLDCRGQGFRRTLPCGGLALMVWTTAVMGTALASDYTSQADGNWNDPSTWTPNGVPTESNDDNAYIYNNIGVTDTESAGYIGINADILTVQQTGSLTSFETVLGVDGTLEIQTGGSLSATSMVSYGGTMNLGDTVDFDSPLYLLSGSQRIEVDQGATATISSAINDFGLGDFGSVTKTGSGTLILSASNSYSGGTEVAGGILIAENNNALGSEAVTVDLGASLELTGGITIPNAITISGTGSSGQGAIYGYGTSNVSQVTDTVNGTVTLSANASVGADNSLTILQLGAINLQSSTLTTSGSGEVYFGGNITGTGGITIGGSGPVFFVGGQNNFTGLTDVLADGYVGLNDTSGTAISGNLTIEDTAEVLDAYGGQFASSTIVTINGDGQLVLTPYGTTVAETIAGVVSTSTDSQVSSYGSSPGKSVLTLDGSGTYDFTGFVLDAVNSPLTVVKEGTGSQEFDGANTYSGGTTLNAGTLIAGNSSAFGTGLMQVNGGRLMMGNNTHTLTVGSYAQTGGTLYLQLAGAGQAATADQLHVTNSSPSQVALGGNLTVDLSGFTNPAPHGTPVSYTFDLLDTDAGYTGKFASFDVIDSATGLIPSLDYTGDDVLLHLSDLLPSGGLTSNQRAILNSIDAGLSGNQVPPPLTALFTALTPYSSNPAVLGAALDQLSAQAFGQFASATAFNNASFETQALDNYLETRRGADGGFLAGHGAIDSSGLTANDPSYDPNLSMIHSRLLAWNPAPFDGTISDVDEMLPGGVEMKDSKNGTPAEMEAHPWNVFIRGNVVLAQGFSGEDTSHFDDNTESVVLGADYRLTPHFLVGLTAGFAHTDVTLDDNGSSATVDSYSPGFYASYADQGWYANLSGNYLHNAYTQDRVIGFLDQTATSSPQGNEGVANLDGGYDFHQGALTFGPLAGLQYTHLSVDGYKESGSLAALDVDNDDSDSLRSRFGGHLSYAFSHDGIHFTPHLDASWQHEFLDQSRGLTSQFGFGGGSFGVRTINPSRDSALVDAGLDADLNRTVTVFADYVIQAGQENYFGQSIQAGLKIGF